MSITFDRVGPRELRLRAETRLATSVAAVFPFFSDARNLEALTPPWLRFEIETSAPEMQPGALIDYRLRVRGIPIRWRTLIESFDPPNGFVDRQLRGPYRQWIHTHTFEALDGMTIARDEVRYWPLGGRVADALVVRRDLRRVFEYRTARLVERFGAP